MTAIIIYKIETFVILMLLGVLAAKLGVLKQEKLNVLSGFLVKITFPCLGFALIYDAKVTFGDLVWNWKFLIAELLLSAFLLILGLTTGRIFRLPEKTRQIHVIQTMFGNQGFMNIPILLSLFVNGEAGAYIALFTLIDQLLLWSLGVMIMSSSDEEKPGILTINTFKTILNPMNICIILAVVFTSLHIQLPEVIATTVTSVGNTSFSLALIFLGATLSYVSLRDFSYAYDYIFLVVGKMLIVPIAAAKIAACFLTPTETTIITLMAAMPAMSAIPMMAENYKSDAAFASKTVLVMTACSVITIPMVFWIIGF